MKRVITINSNNLEKSIETKELLTKKILENKFLVSSILSKVFPLKFKFLISKVIKIRKNTRLKV